MRRFYHGKRELVQQLVKNPLIAGSGIVFTGSFIANILGYLFNLIMGRTLPISEYGLLVSLTSLMVLFGLFQTSLMGIFAKFSAKYSATNNKVGFSTLYHSGIKFILIFSGVIFAVLLLATPLFNNLLKVNSYPYLILMFSAIFFSIVYAFPFGVLQGELKFKISALLTVLGPFIKIVLPVGLLLLGFGLIGVISGISTSTMIPVVIGIFVIRKTHSLSNSDAKLKTSVFLQEFKRYSIYFFLATLGITIIANADIILVRYFFEPEVSGQYAALSLMGKAIFYLTSPIYFVFFPLLAQKKEKKEKIFSTVFMTLVLITGISASLSFIYFIFPGLVLKIFFPSPAYQVLKEYLGPFSLFILIFSIVNLLHNYFLSTGKTQIYKFNLTAAVIFVILFTFFHSSLFQVIAVLFATSAILLVTYVLYYFSSK